MTTPLGVLLTDEALEELATRVAALLAERHPAPAGPVAYTVATLAAELDVSEKTIRGAIHRGELNATRRGSRYLITADAARDWATNPAARPANRNARARGARVRNFRHDRQSSSRPLAAALRQMEVSP